MNDLLKIRTYLIISSVFLGMVLVWSKANGSGWLGLHPPELEGGIEVTIENMKDGYFSEYDHQERIAQERMERFERDMEEQNRVIRERSCEIDRTIKEQRDEQRWQDQEDVKIKEAIEVSRRLCHIEEIDG